MKLGSKFTTCFGADLVLEVSHQRNDDVIDMLDDAFDDFYAEHLRADKGGLVLDIAIGETDEEGLTSKIGEAHLIGRDDDLRVIYAELVNRDDLPHELLRQMAEDQEAFENWREQILATMF